MNERIPVQFDRALRPEWIDFALEQRFQTDDEKALRRVLRDYLEPQIKGTEALQKTIGQLQRTVGHRAALPETRLREFHVEMGKLPPEARTPIRLAILTESHPFFADCYAALQKLHALGVEGVTLQQMYERIVARYGDRGTVFRCVRYALQTLAFLGVVRNQNRRWYLENQR
jgi:hypothetical protein